MKKKGQAAMEFLMTYGWAILAAVIVVGVLWYLIGNPSNLAGNNFQLSAPLSSNAMSLSTAGVELEFRNGEATSINVTSIAFADESTCDQDFSGSPIQFAAGQLGNLTAGCTLISGDRFNSGVTITYVKSGSSLSQIATGSVSGTVP